MIKGFSRNDTFSFDILLTLSDVLHVKENLEVLSKELEMMLTGLCLIPCFLISYQSDQLLHYEQ